MDQQIVIISILKIDLLKSEFHKKLQLMKNLTVFLYGIN